MVILLDIQIFQIFKVILAECTLFVMDQTNITTTKNAHLINFFISFFLYFEINFFFINSINSNETSLMICDNFNASRQLIVSDSASISLPREIYQACRVLAICKCTSLLMSYASYQD